MEYKITSNLVSSFMPTLYKSNKLAIGSGRKKKRKKKEDEKEKGSRQVPHPPLELNSTQPLPNSGPHANPTII
jgi:hypothetical protein